MSINIDGEKLAYKKFTSAGMTPAGACGMIGNAEAESDGFYPTRLEYLLNQRFRENNIKDRSGKWYTDESYTAELDEGMISCESFLHPIPGKQYGYGIVQWTSPGRKSGLWNYLHQKNVSMGDLEGQIDYVIKELKESFAGVWSTLTTAVDIRVASDKVLIDFEQPDGITEAMKVSRAARGQAFYDKYVRPGSMKEETKVANYDKYINSTGTHYISNSGSDENGKISGGSAGDQTGKEWQLRSWYDRPWNCVLRHPDEKVRMKLAELSCAAALNDKIGYDQGQRYTYWDQLVANKYDPSKIKVACEEDCSAGVLSNVKAVGYLLGNSKLQSITITSTHYMREMMRNAGFIILTNSIYLKGGDYLLPGDILLNDQHHTCVNITKGKLSSGNMSTQANTSLIGSCSVTLKTFLVGACDDQIRTIQIILSRLGYKGKDGKELKIDGELGENTAYAVEQFQKSKGMKDINFGSVAAKTWQLLVESAR